MEPNGDVSFGFKTDASVDSWVEGHSELQTYLFKYEAKQQSAYVSVSER